MWNTIKARIAPAFGLAAIVLVIVVSMTGCKNPLNDTGPTPITIAALQGVITPVTGAVPVTAITATKQYTGTITWSPADNSFKASTVYTATITLKAKDGYTMEGVAANFFTVGGATTTNAANSGVITAIFPSTAGTTAEPVTIDIAVIGGVTAPITGAVPITAITETAQYTGTVIWNGSPATFAASTVYTATITLTAKNGFTLTGVAADFFTVAGATTTNEANSGVITAVFPATGESADNTITGGGGGSGGNGSGGEDGAIYLRAVRWSDEGSSGEKWSSGDQIKLSDFTTVKPKKGGDVLQVKISGVSDKEIKYVRIGLYQVIDGDWSTYKWIGNSQSPIGIPQTFNNIFDINTWSDSDFASNDFIYVDLEIFLWQTDSSGEYMYNSGETLPAGVKDGDVMATIRDFSISLVENQQWKDYWYSENNTGITITRYEGAGGNVIIPAQINGKSVTSIGNKAFYSCTSLTSITMPNSVISIGEWVFQDCHNLTSVIIPNSRKIALNNSCKV